MIPTAVVEEDAVAAAAAAEVAVAVAVAEDEDDTVEAAEEAAQLF